ncbi:MULTISPECIES: MFS transporter [unclassified Streptosporangium]|uniref:MFS transporter n=1 Tax=unclassified Streptosporangium TaxID=2632669 RepID=UPI002E2E22DA|nr:MULTISPECIES: MFS transporter [unclassified Streptosporangium]
MDRVRRVRPDRDSRAGRGAHRGVGSGRRGTRGRGGGRGAARAVGGVPAQTAGDDRDGPDPVRGADERSRRPRARPAELRSTPGCGGLIGSRLARPLLARFGQHKVMLTAGTLRACWPLGLALISPGPTGLVLVIAVELGLITCMGVFNPVFATYRLERLPSDRVARTLSAWSITSKATIAAMTGVWGLLAGLTGPRTAIAIAGLLLLATPLLLPRHDRTPQLRNADQAPPERRTPA